MIYDFNYRWFMLIYDLPWFTYGDFPHVTLPPGICCIFWRTHAHALQEQTLLPSFPMHSVLGICKRQPFVEWLNPIVNGYHICILYISIYIYIQYRQTSSGGFSKRWCPKTHFLEHFAKPMDLGIPHFNKPRVTALSSSQISHDISAVSTSAPDPTILRPLARAKGVVWPSRLNEALDALPRSSKIHHRMS